MNDREWTVLSALNVASTRHGTWDASDGERNYRATAAQVLDVIRTDDRFVNAAEPPTSVRSCARILRDLAGEATTARKVPQMGRGKRPVLNPSRPFRRLGALVERVPGERGAWRLTSAGVTVLGA